MLIPQIFFKSVFKSTEYPSRLARTTVGRCCQLPFATYSAPYLPALVPSLRHRVRCGHFWNCDLTNSFSLVTHHHKSHPHHHTSHSHRIPGIAQRGTRDGSH